MTRTEKIQYRVATIGAAATLLAAVVTPSVQLIDEAGDGGMPMSCSTAVERVVEVMEDHPALADAYGDAAEDMPDLFSDEEEEACGNPQRLEEEVGDEVSTYSEEGRAISRR